MKHNCKKEINDLNRREKVLISQKQHLQEQQQHSAEKYVAYQEAIEKFEQTLSLPLIDQEIEALKNEMEKQVNAIVEIVELNQPARNLINAHNSLNLRIAHLRDMKAVLEGNKYFANSKGERVESLNEAAFILDKGWSLTLSPEKKYILDNGTHPTAEQGKELYNKF